MQRRDVRPRSPGQIIDAGVAVYVRSFVPITLSVAAIVVPIALIELWNVRNVPASGLLDVFADALDPIGTQTPVEPVPFSWANTALGLASNLLGIAVAVVVAVGVYRGEPLTTVAALKSLARRLIPIVLLGVVFLAGAAAGLIALVFPGIWLMTAWSLSLPAMIDEGLGVRQSLNRSFRLTKGRLLSMLGILVLTLMLQAVFAYVGILATLAAEALTSLSASFLVTDSLVGTVAALFTIPLLGSVLTAAYYDHRIRREGLDLALAIGEIETPHQTPPSEVPERDVFGFGPR